MLPKNTAIHTSASADPYSRCPSSAPLTPCQSRENDTMAMAKAPHDASIRMVYGCPAPA